MGTARAWGCRAGGGGARGPGRRPPGSQTPAWPAGGPAPGAPAPPDSPGGAEAGAAGPHRRRAARGARGGDSMEARAEGARQRLGPGPVAGGRRGGPTGGPPANRGAGGRGTLRAQEGTVPCPVPHLPTPSASAHTVPGAGRAAGLPAPSPARRRRLGRGLPAWLSTEGTHSSLCARPRSELLCAAAPGSCQGAPSPGTLVPSALPRLRPNPLPASQASRPSAHPSGASLCPPPPPMPGTRGPGGTRLLGPDGVSPDAAARARTCPALRVGSPTCTGRAGPAPHGTRPGQEGPAGPPPPAQHRSPGVPRPAGSLGEGCAGHHGPARRGCAFSTRTAEAEQEQKPKRKEGIW